MTPRAVPALHRRGARIVRRGRDGAATARAVAGTELQSRAGSADRDLVQGLSPPGGPGPGDPARSRRADPGRAHRRARSQPETCGARADPRHGARTRPSSSPPICWKRWRRSAPAPSSSTRAASSPTARRRRWRRARPPAGWTTSSARSPPATPRPPERRHEFGLAGLRARIRILFRHAAGLCLHRDLPVRDGRLHFLCRPFLRQWHRRSDRVLRLSSLALSVPGAGPGDAAVGGRAPQRHHGIAAHPAGAALGHRAGQVSRRLGLCRPGAGPHLSDLADGQLSGPSRQWRDPRLLYRQLPDGGRLSVHRRLHLGGHRPTR